MKKVFSLVLFVILTVAVSVTAFAADSDIIASGYCGGEGDGTNLEWVLTEDGTLTISGEGKMADYETWYGPDESYTLAPWGEYKNQINSLVLEEGITRIGDKAFGLMGIEGELIIPSTVKSIGTFSFEHNSFSQKNLVIPEGVEKIETGAFQAGGNFENVYIPASVKRIEGVSFRYGSTKNIIVDENNSDYKSVEGVLFTKDGTKIMQFPAGRNGKYVVPEEVSVIEEGAFENSKLSLITVKGKIEYIEVLAFRGFVGMVAFEQNVYEMEDTVFESYNLPVEILFMAGPPEKILMEDGRFTFGRSCEIFYLSGTEDLWELDENGLWNGYEVKPFNTYEEVELDPSLYVASGYCGNDPITDGKNLAWGIDKNGVLKIFGKGEMADYENGKLENGQWGINSPWYQYRNDISSIKIEEGITRISDYAFSGAYETDGKVTIPESVMSIGDYAFQSVAEGSVTIPSAVVEIGNSPFANCIYLEEINVAKENQTFCSVDGKLYSKDMKTLYAWPNLRNEKTAVVPEGVTTIATGAFDRLVGKNMNVDIILPETVKILENDTFIVNGRVIVKGQLDFVSTYALSPWGGSLSFYFFNGPPKEASKYAFDAEADGPIGLYYLSGTEDLWEFDENGLWNGYEVNEINAEDVIIASGYCGGEGDGTNLEWVLTEDGTLTISGEGKMECYKSTNNGKQITSAPWGEYSDHLKTLVIEEGVTNIGCCAFAFCSGFEGTLVIPNSVTIIEDSAFVLCSGFTGNLVIPNNVTEIGWYAFYKCDGFNGKLIIGKGITNIGVRAFYGCSKLTGNLFIHNDEISIGGLAFCNCGINNYYFGGDAPEMVRVPGESIIYDHFDKTDDTIYYPSGNSTWEVVDGKWKGYNAVAWEVPFEIGDINQDRKVDVKDVYFARLVAAKLVVPTEEEFSLGDVDGNGRINVIDANLIRKFCANIITKFPVEG